ncbi:hypothetical protein Tcan_16091 [Toxocara canis]|uniref:Uncharacterized protein n=1 Tax=Toxocara canis TaxID=6265 RepID=A0A0B2UZJ6_TOXCA|nr:hypothetical protein Tcan_16091 [Toxocara canis]
MLSSQSKSEGFASSSYVAPSGDSNSRSSISSSPSPPRYDNIERFDVQISRSRRPLFKLTFDNDIGNSWDSEECDYQRKLDPSFGNVHNFYSSFELPQLRARSDSPVSSSAFMERDVTQRGRRSIRPTRLPILMTRKQHSVVMVMHGSHERLADDSEDTPFNVSRKLLDRCLRFKMPSVRRYTKRSLLTPLTRRPREWTYGSIMMRIPQKTFSVHDVGRIGSAELSGQCCTPNTMIRSCFADCGDDGLHYLPDDSFALQCASIAHQIQARFAENPSLHSTSSSRSMSPRKKSTTGQLLPRRCKFST